MDTWNCIEASLWEDFGQIKVCRECGYPMDFGSIKTHPQDCSLGNVTKMFAEKLQSIEPEVEEKRTDRHEEWQISKVI